MCHGSDAPPFPWRGGLLPARAVQGLQGCGECGCTVLSPPLGGRAAALNKAEAVGCGEQGAAGQHIRQCRGAFIKHVLNKVGAREGFEGHVTAVKQLEFTWSVAEHAVPCDAVIV